MPLISREIRLVGKFGSALVLLELSEASSPESSSLQTQVTDLELQPGSWTCGKCTCVLAHGQNNAELCQRYARCLERPIMLEYAGMRRRRRRRRRRRNIVKQSEMTNHILSFSFYSYAQNLWNTQQMLIV